MVSILLIAHIILLSSSLLVTMSSVFFAIVGYQVPKLVTSLNTVGTVVGLLFGIALLASSPLDAKCAALFAYLVAFFVAQAYISRRNQVLALSVDS